MGVMNWPGLEKRTEVFEQASAADEIKMIYVKEGSATITESSEGGTETAEVTAGQIVMLSDGLVQWQGIADGGIVLLSTTTSVEDIEELDDSKESKVTTQEPPDELSLVESAGV